jgi:pimeloyl-ACP methyl ester carboxylesterase
VTRRRIAVHYVREGTLKGCLSYISFGDGPPLVVFPGLFPSNANPTGLLLRFEMGWLSPIARAFTVYRINRKVGLAPDTTMADLASHYAAAIEDRFEGAIHILGFSTGGSIAQQFAADRPDLVHRLISPSISFLYRTRTDLMPGPYTPSLCRGSGPCLFKRNTSWKRSP